MLSFWYHESITCYAFTLLPESSFKLTILFSTILSSVLSESIAWQMISTIHGTKFVAYMQLTKYATRIAWNLTLSGPPLPSSLSPAASGHGARLLTSSMPDSMMAFE